MKANFRRATRPALPRGTILSRAVTLTVSATVLNGAATAHAHEKWFYEGPPQQLRWDLFFRPEPLTYMAVVVALIVAAAVLWRMRGRRDFVPGPDAFGAADERRMAFYGLVPAILGLHIAIPLLTYGLQGKLFSPNNDLSGAWVQWIGVAETFIALSFFYGGFTRLAALVLMVIWAAGIGLLGLEPMLENLHYLGYAGFFFLAGRGPIAIDRLLFPRMEPPASYVPYAPVALRIGIGLSLAIVGFTEKLANLPLAEAFLAQHPLNFTAWFGIPMSDRTFALCAGSVEVLAGSLIALGIFPRTIILIALFPLNLSLTVFNWVELVGHMPFYGALAVLLIWTPRDRDLWVAGVRQGPLAVGN